jgi:hypothetical protein
MGFFIPLLVSLAINIIAFALMPKPPAPKPPAVGQQKVPLVEIGTPVPVVFGTVMLKQVFVLAAYGPEVTPITERVKGGK